MNTIVETVTLFGGDPAAVLLFDTDEPNHLAYATLLAARNANQAGFDVLAGVYEWQQRPLILLVDGRRLPDDAEALKRLRRAAAMRGDAPYIGVVHPGRLTVYQVGLDDYSPQQARVTLPSPEGLQAETVPFLANRRPQVTKSAWISDVVLGLLSESIDALVQEGVDKSDAISLVGRALFIRFLADRHLLTGTELLSNGKAVAELFETASSIRSTSRWLDDTFNGDFLPLTEAAIANLTTTALHHLGNILHHAPGGQLHLPWQESWDRLDFAHIPVGVLSQAYERYLNRHAPAQQHLEGGYYTPPHIAELMVRAAFSGLGENADRSAARVLDPSAGAGVFLLSSFRHLVYERWKKDKVRPNTPVLRSILYNQITGFDINESALRFAALGLYLLSIELDPDPEPIEKLRFSNLRNAVLFKFRAAQRPAGGTSTNRSEPPQLGSLGGEVSPVHRHRYDIVVGNPPWSTSTKLQGWQWLKDHITKLARERTENEHLRAPLPNEVLDLPFVWRALEWAKPNGQIAFALHARLLFEQGEGMPEARIALFSALDVTGIINGSELRNTNIWPGITAPFCLLFARNQLPPPGSAFRFVTPRPDVDLNRAGAWRLDVSNAETISHDEVLRKPFLLKTLFRGSRLDAEILDRVAENKWPTLRELWAKTFGLYRGRPRCMGNGYQTFRPSSRVRRYGDGLPGVPAEYLHGKPHLTASARPGLRIISSQLKPFTAARIHDRRSPEIFRGPLLLIHESPKVEHGRISVSVSYEDVVYSQSYHGYSAAEHEKGLLLIKYIALILSSRFALWHALMTSGRFGFEREVIEKFIVESTPIPPMDMDDKERINNIENLFSKCSDEQNDFVWDEIDKWAAELYGLSDEETLTISDTLTYNLPFSENRQLSQRHVGKQEILAFSSVLESELAPWAERFNRRLAVLPARSSATSPWQFICLTPIETASDVSLNPPHRELIRAADAVAATEILVEDKGNHALWIGRLDQARYWSRNHARLAARQIVWEHMGFVSGSEA